MYTNLLDLEGILAAPPVAPVPLRAPHWRALLVATWVLASASVSASCLYFTLTH